MISAPDATMNKQGSDPLEVHLCAPGQEGCSLGIEDGAIAMTYTSPKGVDSRYRVDLTSMDIAAWETRPGEEERSVSFATGAKCVREPLPEGLKIN